MARQLRIEYPGAIYHVMNCGDRREPVFYDDADRRRFVVTLEQYLEQRRAQEDGGELKRIRRGWCLGGETFRQELLEQARTVAGESRVEKLKIEPDEQNEFNPE